jgi:excisionase family DNA binding protein
MDAPWLGGYRNEALVRLVGMTTVLRTADEVAARLRVPKSWVYRAAREGELPSIQCGRYRRFDDRDVDRWIDHMRQSARVAG